MKILVTGSNGQLGYDVVKECQQRNIDCIAATRNECDLSDEAGLKNFIRNCRPDTVIHCAAYTAVDKAEDEPELCRKINVDGTRYIAESCREIGAKLVYISTDYVFDGAGTEPYATDAPTNPINVYGQTKLAGEIAVQANVDRYFIVRISWVFGKHGNNFVKTMLRLGKERSELHIVADQIGSPTYTPDLAKLLIDMTRTEKYGVYHATNEGTCSWTDFAEEIFRQAGMTVRVQRIGSEAYPMKARRPMNSRLSKASLINGGFDLLPNWKAALKSFMNGK